MSVATRAPGIVHRGKKIRDEHFAATSHGGVSDAHEGSTRCAPRTRGFSKQPSSRHRKTVRQVLIEAISSQVNHRGGYTACSRKTSGDWFAKSPHVKDSTNPGSFSWCKAKETSCGSKLDSGRGTSSTCTIHHQSRWTRAPL